MEPAFLYTIGTAVFVGGVSAGMVKASLNGTKERVRQIHETLQTHINDEADNDRLTHERLAGVEAKVDILLEKL